MPDGYATRPEQNLPSPRAAAAAHWTLVLDSKNKIDRQPCDAAPNRNDRHSEQRGVIFCAVKLQSQWVPSFRRCIDVNPVGVISPSPSARSRQIEKINHHEGKQCDQEPRQFGIARVFRLPIGFGLFCGLQPRQLHFCQSVVRL
jgi:hypothetical protein